MRRISRVGLVVFALFISTTTWAGVPQTLHYSGKLDTAGAAFTGTVDVGFSLYEDANTATGFWSDTQAVAGTNGRFHVQLGPLSAADVDVAALHLGVAVGADDEMDRVAIASVPYALRASEAGNAATVGGQAASCESEDLAAGGARRNADRGEAVESGDLEVGAEGGLGEGRARAEDGGDALGHVGHLRQNLLPLRAPLGRQDSRGPRETPPADRVVRVPAELRQEVQRAEEREIDSRSLRETREAIATQV